jgi:hypothetical protein
MGEQVDYLRFMPEKTASQPPRWWLGVIVGGPGWVVPGIQDARRRPARLAGAAQRVAGRTRRSTPTRCT